MKNSPTPEMIEGVTENGVQFYRRNHGHSALFPDPVPVETHIEDKVVNYVTGKKISEDVEHTDGEMTGWIVPLPARVNTDDNSVKIQNTGKTIAMRPILTEVESDCGKYCRINTCLGASTSEGIGMLITNPTFYNTVNDPVQVETELIDTGNVPQYIKPKIKINPDKIRSPTKILSFGHPIAHIIPVEL